MNAAEAAVGTVPGDAAECSTGILAVMTTLPAAGRLTIRWLYLLEALIHFPIAKSSASHVTSKLVLTDVVNSDGGRNAPAPITLHKETSTCLILRHPIMTFR